MFGPPPMGKPQGIEPLTETADFRADDDGCFVAASLSCPWCLSWDVGWKLREGGGYDAHATCRCGECGREREVFLTPEQELRLALQEERPLDTRPRSSDGLLAY